MKSLLIKQQISDTSSNSAGFQLYTILENYIRRDDVVEIDLRDSLAFSSSFFNSSFGELIENYGYSKVTKLLKFKNVTTNQKSLLKSYFDTYKNLASN